MFDVKTQDAVIGGIKPKIISGVTIEQTDIVPQHGPYPCIRDQRIDSLLPRVPTTNTVSAEPHVAIVVLRYRKTKGDPHQRLFFSRDLGPCSGPAVITFHLVQ